MGSAVRLPKYRDGPVHGRAHEVPLSATEVSGTGHEDDPLVEAAKLDAKPAFVLAAHVGANHAGGDIAPIRVRPSNSPNADVRTRLDEPLSSEPVQIQPQSVLKANSFAWS